MYSSESEEQNPMSHQGCALHGDLVPWLRDWAAELLAGDPGSVEAEQERLDQLSLPWPAWSPRALASGCRVGWMPWSRGAFGSPDLPL